jgi:dsDNA-specific endonuclease/ATPase MutS2
MADRAQVTSVEAIESFRSALVIYLSKVRPALEEMSSEVLRARQWLQNDQRRLWEGEMKIRAKKLERAKAELFSVSMSKFQEVSSAAVDEAQKKLSVLKKWDNELGNRSEPLIKQVDQFQSFVTAEMPRAIAYLTQVIRSLEAYAEIRMSGTADAGAPEKIEEPPADGAAPGRAKEEPS